MTEPTNTEIMARLDAIETMMTQAFDAIMLVESQVKPMIESLSNSPIMKMLGGKSR